MIDCGLARHFWVPGRAAVSMQMDGKLKEEQIGTLIVRVRILEGRGVGVVGGSGGPAQDVHTLAGENIFVCS
eukprot:1156632-Pelagomonas_calceolata.AAC.9